TAERKSQKELAGLDALVRVEGEGLRQVEVVRGRPLAAGVDGGARTRVAEVSVVPVAHDREAVRRGSEVLPDGLITDLEGRVIDRVPGRRRHVDVGAGNLTMEDRCEGGHELGVRVGILV